ncbi:MAG: hypothetical protein KGI29_09770 [Pseudomonadota bacterium]|nr:hypothetical protein [Pseudomonadota bacterium]
MMATPYDVASGDVGANQAGRDSGHSAVAATAREPGVAKTRDDVMWNL